MAPPGLVDLRGPGRRNRIDAVGLDVRYHAAREIAGLGGGRGVEAIGGGGGADVWG